MVGSAENCLRTDHHFIGRAGQAERDPSGLIGLDGLRQIERRKLNRAIPCAGRVIVHLGVEYSVRNRVTGYFLPMPIGKN